MIEIRNLSKEFYLAGVRRVLFRGLNLRLPSGVPVALLGRNGSGKTTLLRIVSGIMDPSRGEVVSDGTVSWPVGFAGSFHPELTGSQNTRFVARIYGVDSDELSDFVQSFAGIGRHFHLPFRSYSAGMRSRLAFGVSMGIPFDTYLVDEVTSVGDGAFREKSAEVFAARMRNAGAIVVSHSMPLLKRFCTAGVVLTGDGATYHPAISDAIDHHNAVLGLGAAPA
ncbi:ATP-binding cassette domain-containing protein [Rhodobacterales bacterium HKCCE2091]|nr:ATP-binding cassette domain-containing protein [Rhodobacterales bacterium HKCCE2091]